VLRNKDDDDDDPRGIPASDTEMQSAVFGSSANNSDVYGAVTFDSQGEYGAGPAAIGDDYMKAPAPATEYGNAAVVDEYMKPGPPAMEYQVVEGTGAYEDVAIARDDDFYDPPPVTSDSSYEPL